jgi:hypothetical protein
VGFVVDKVTLGQIFSEYFGFPCQSSFHQFFPQSPSPIIRGLYNRPVVAAIPKEIEDYCQDEKLIQSQTIDVAGK